MDMREDKPDRRDLLKAALAAGMSSALFPREFAAAAEQPTLARPDLFRAENERPGTTDWVLTSTRVEPKSKLRSPWVEGYCSRTSLRASERLAIMVSTNPASPFVIDIYRLGYYGGKGGRFVERLGPFKGQIQPDPEVGAERLRECQWEPAVEFEIPADWPSGVYVGKLTAELEGLQSYVIFIVRDDRVCDFLFQCSDSTWAAYNCWPDKWSLYHTARKRWYCGPGVQVSFDRPYSKCRIVTDTPQSIGSGEFLLWEFPLAYWMEKHGYDVSYISNVDTHADAAGLKRAKAWLSVGHDEYYSREMFENVRTAVANGLNVAFFSGDVCWGVIPFLPSTNGVPHRVITRVGTFGPMDEKTLRDFPEMKNFDVQLPSQALLIGAGYTFPGVGVTDWVCTAEDHWLYAGTGMKNGDRIPSLVGWEWQGQPLDIPGLEVVSRGVVKGRNDEAEFAATVYPGPRQNWVVNASTIWWSNGLSAPPGYKTPEAYESQLQGPDRRVEQMTHNILRRFMQSGRQET